MKPSTFLLILTLLISSCGSKDEDLSGGICSASIVNGKTDHNDSLYPSVVKLTLNDSGTCTGTFISSRTILTAAHCVDNVFPWQVRVSGLHETPSQIHIHSGYTSNWDEETKLWYDVAVINFGHDVAPAIISLYEGDLNVGDEFTVVGYGKVPFEVKAKRYGKNTISEIRSGEVSNGYIVFDGVTYHEEKELGTDVSAFFGDSGGPLLINNQLAGAASHITVVRGFFGGKEPGGQSVYVNLQTETIKNFIRTNMVGTDVPVDKPEASEENQPIVTPNPPVQPEMPEMPEMPEIPEMPELPTWPEDEEEWPTPNCN